MLPVNMMLAGTIKTFAHAMGNGLWDQVAKESAAAGTRQGEIEVSRRLYEMQARWEETGRRIYELTPELTVAFAETEFPLSARDISAPHQSFYIASPRANLLIDNGVDDLKIDGWYVDFWLPEVMQVLAVSEQGDMAFSHFAVPMDVNIDEYLEQTLEGSREKVFKNAERMAVWARVVAGTCAYLASEKPSVDRELYGKRREHRENTDKKKLAAEAVSINYFRVGDGEKWAAHFSADSETRRLTRRHVVRGHYRRLSQGRTTWVRPYWKGPEWGEVARATITRVQGGT